MQPWKPRLHALYRCTSYDSGADLCTGTKTWPVDGRHSKLRGFPIADRLFVGIRLRDMRGMNAAGHPGVGDFIQLAGVILYDSDIAVLEIEQTDFRAGWRLRCRGLRLRSHRRCVGGAMIAVFAGRPRRWRIAGGYPIRSPRRRGCRA